MTNAAPKKLKDANAELWHVIDEFIEEYNRFDLIRMSEADLLLAAVIVLTVNASWTVNDKFRLDAHAAKAFGTTVKRIGAIFPDAWYEMRDDDLYNVRVPQRVLDSISKFQDQRESLVA